MDVLDMKLDKEFCEKFAREFTEKLRPIFKKMDKVLRARVRINLGLDCPGDWDLVVSEM